MASLSLALHDDSVDEDVKIAFKGTLALRCGSFRSSDCRRYSQEIFPRIYALQWLLVQSPEAELLPRTEFFAGKLRRGPLDSSLQACVEVTDCIRLAEIQSESALRKRISHLIQFLRGSLNGNEMRMTGS